jgi:hypothetical protein
MPRLVLPPLRQCQGTEFRDSMVTAGAGLGVATPRNVQTGCMCCLSRPHGTSHLPGSWCGADSVSLGILSAPRARQRYEPINDAGPRGGRGRSGGQRRCGHRALFSPDEIMISSFANALFDLSEWLAGRVCASVDLQHLGVWATPVSSSAVVVTLTAPRSMQSTIKIAHTLADMALDATTAVLRTAAHALPNPQAFH